MQPIVEINFDQLCNLLWTSKGNPCVLIEMIGIPLTKTSTTLYVKLDQQPDG